MDMDCDDDETRETQKLHNGGVTKYNVDISGEDKDKVIRILNELNESKEALELMIDYNVVPYHFEKEIYCLKRLKKILGEEK